MKLATTLLACGAFADERMYANNVNFHAQQESFWTKPWFNHEEYWNNILDNGIPPIKAAFNEAAAAQDAPPLAARVAQKYSRDVDKLVNTVEKWNERCQRKIGNGTNSGRKRRSDERAFNFEDSSLDQDMGAVWNNIAKYARNQLWECRNDLPMFQLYKRIDRFRWIYYRQYCNLINPDAEFCSWALIASNGSPFSGPFIQMSWFDNKFGIGATMKPEAAEAWPSK